MKKTFFHGFTSGILAGIAAIVYNRIYCKALDVHFTKIVSTLGLLASCLIGCLLAALGYYFFSKVVKKNTDVWFNIILLALSFASFAGGFQAKLPLDVDSPELFIGLVIPMHLFPALFWLATKPLFWKNSVA